MAIQSARHMLINATRGGYAVGAFNVTSAVQMLSVIQTATQLRAPVIVQTSVTPAKFYGPKMLAAMYRSLASDTPVPVCLHLDHCEEVDFCKRCADAGYTNIMIDGSHHGFEENIRTTREVANYCHALGDVSVEGELGTVSGVEDQIKVAEDEAQLANPDHALRFVTETTVDLFAPAIGTAHGVYLTENPKIDFERFEKIAQIVNRPNLRAPLVVHGGTGLKPDVVRRLVSLGGSKFNVSTELKHTLIDATFDYVNNSRADYNPGKLDKVVKDATSAAVAAWIKLLGSDGKAGEA